MRRSCFLALLPVLLWACSGEPRYTEPQLPVEKRVEDLLSRMSLEEKVAQASAQRKAGSKCGWERMRMKRLPEREYMLNKLLNIK